MAAILLTIFALISFLTFILIYDIQSKPYMDEVFHISQAQRYCEGKFNEWNPMITTLPGLYLITMFLIKTISWICQLDHSIFCVTLWLRTINIFFALGNFYVLYLILQSIHGTKKNRHTIKCLWTSFNLVTLPVLYFFTFFYYTDAGSVFFVLLMYLFFLHNRNGLAALTGVIAVMMRQTNILWIIFAGGEVALKIILSQGHFDKRVKKEKVLFLKVFIEHHLKNSFNNNVKVLYRVILHTWPYLSVGIGFIIFVIVNNGIVVGDRSSHQACFHLPQFFYCISFIFCFSCPLFLSLHKMKAWCKYLIDNHKLMTILTLLCVIAVKFFTYAHPYLLADNRHYTFYIWKNIFQQHYLIKFFLIPGYIFAAWQELQLVSHKNILWKILFILIVLMATVPQKLLEFRYFILPFLFYRIHIPLQKYKTLITELILYIFINSFTIFLFIKKTFYWQDSQDPQRIMW